ncbi:MAG: DUF5684 domain-containing protein [Lachnospiraceae bacterium]|nr:DUF5684 domain-containing protein [Lachnospiraceae bacterium]
MFLAEAGAAAVGLGVMGILVVAIIWYILVIIGDWKIFEKAGKPGWHSLIPFLNLYDEYDLCWNGSMGIVYMVALGVSTFLTSGSEDVEVTGFKAIVAGVLAIVALVLRIIQSNKLAKAFGHGIGFTLFLIVFERIARVILGFGSSEYEGPQ